MDILILIVVSILSFNSEGLANIMDISSMEVEREMDRPIVESKPSDISEYNFTDDEIYLLTVLLCGSKEVDGDGEYDFDYGNQNNEEQIYLVLNVVMNRVKSPQFPNSISEVIWAKNQFVLMPRWRDKLPEVSPNSLQIISKWCERYGLGDDKVRTIPENHLYFTGNGVVNVSGESW